MVLLYYHTYISCILTFKDIDENKLSNGERKENGINCAMDLDEEFDVKSPFDKGWAWVMLAGNDYHYYIFT